MTVGVICAVMVESTVSSALRATSVILPCQRKATVRSAPRKPFTRETPAILADSSNVPLSNWTSVFVPAAWAVTEAMVATGPVKDIWFHGSARWILATTSSLNWKCPGCDATSI